MRKERIWLAATVSRAIWLSEIPSGIDMDTNTSHCAIAETIIAMAHKLGLKVIAEGIETEEQMKMLAHAGCDYGQGYLFSPAIPEHQVLSMLNTRFLM